MARQDPPSPTLPTNVLELVLATVPHFSCHIKHAHIFSLLNVLSQATVPTVAASLVSNFYAYDEYHVDKLERALGALFQRHRDPLATAAATLLFNHMKEALVNNVGDCLLHFSRFLGQTGNLELLKHLVSIDDVELSDCSSVVHAAAAAGHVHIMQWWFENELPMHSLTAESIEAAACGGHLNVLEWWRKLDPALEFDFLVSAVPANLVANGRLEILKWWIKHIVSIGFVFLDKYWVLASEHGHTEVLKFAAALGHPFPRSIACCIDAAAANGHIHVLDWWYHNLGRKRALAYTVNAMDQASANGHIDILNWFLKSGLELRFTPCAVQLACENGHADVVKWWSESRLAASLMAGVPPPSNVRIPSDFVTLCAFGHSDSLNSTLISKQSQATLAHALQVACRHGQVAILNLLGPHCGFVSTPPTCGHFNVAVEQNQVATLQWCLRNHSSGLPGFEFWFSGVVIALERGHVEALQVLHLANVLAWDRYDGEYVRAVCRGGMIRSLEFIHTTLCSVDKWDWQSQRTSIKTAACHGHVHILQWLHQEGVDFANDLDSWLITAIDGASVGGHLCVLQWWDHHKLPFEFSELALWSAVKSGHRDVVEWWIGSGKVKGQFTLQMLQNALLK